MWKHIREEHQGIMRGEGRNHFKFKMTQKYKEPTLRIADEFTGCQKKGEDSGSQ
jgi:hypothetical protein